MRCDAMRRHARSMRDAAQHAAKCAQFLRGSFLRRGTGFRNRLTRDTVLTIQTAAQQGEGRKKLCENFPVQGGYLRARL